jgi:predicted metal-dependent hydrolase
MAVKKVEMPQIGAVSLYKRKGARSIRLSVTSNGSVRVTLPYWLPFEAGAKFASSKQAWILSQLENHEIHKLSNGMSIGKSHHLYFIKSLVNSKVSSRVDLTEIRITHPDSLPSTHQLVQQSAETACVRALRNQAESLLPQRLRALSNIHDLPYRSSNVKHLKGRWGSCDVNKNITLNLFLMQLPWHLIDYVLVHELIHTIVLHHGTDFWREFEKRLPNAKRLRREIGNYRPVVEGSTRMALANS